MASLLSVLFMPPCYKEMGVECELLTFFSQIQTHTAVMCAVMSRPRLRRANSSESIIEFNTT